MPRTAEPPAASHAGGTVAGVGWPPYVTSWGSTPGERAAAYPGDDLLDDLVDRADGVLFRAIDVAAPAPVVYRWLCQLRVAPYSYDWVDNLGRRSPRRLTEGLDRLEVGQRFMTIFRLAAFEPGRSITLDSATAAFGRVVVTYVVRPAGDGCRLVAKITYRLPRGPYGPLLRALLPPGDVVMMRKQLLTLKSLAERA